MIAGPVHSNRSTQGSYGVFIDAHSHGEPNSIGSTVIEIQAALSTKLVRADASGPPILCDMGIE